MDKRKNNDLQQTTHLTDTAMDKRTNNDLQQTTHSTKDSATGTSLKLPAGSWVLYVNIIFDLDFP